MSVRKGVLLSIFILLASGFIIVYRELYQLNYSAKFFLNGASRKQEFVLYPDTTIYNEQVKFHLEGDINGKATLLALAVHKSKRGSSDSTSLLSLKLENESGIDTTLRLPYYGNRKSDKVIIRYQPIRVQQVDLTIKAGIFGLPFEKILTRFL